MLFWHLAGGIFLFRWIFREPSVDLRFLVLGSLLPDLVDLPIGGLLLADRYALGELWGHSLLAAVMVMSVVMVVFRRGSRRKAGMAVAIGMLFHLLLDRMWTDTTIFLWPFAGFELPTGPKPFWAEAFERASADPFRWLAEVVGVIYLTWLWVWAGLTDAQRRSHLWRTGQIDRSVAVSQR